MLRAEAALKLKAQELKKQAEEALGNGNPEEAVRLLKEALALDPANQVLQDAEKLAEKLLQAARLKEKGLKQMALLEFRPAASTFEAACQLDPDDDELPELKTLAETRAKATDIAQHAQNEFDHGNNDRAFDMFDEALGLYPDSVEIKAMRDACQAELDRRLAELLANIAALHKKGPEDLATTDYAGCVVDCEHAVALDKDLSLIHI